jgi:putative transposase
MFSITTFGELMKGLPRSTFNHLVKRHNADKYCKKFSHWDHLIAMLYGQLSGTSGLRALASGFNSHMAHHYHLGTGAIRRSTLADANERRSDIVFSETANWLMGQVSRKLRKESKQLMFLLDSTSVTLKGHGFDHWSAAHRTRNTQGIKLHMLLDALNETPAWSRFSHANVNDVQMGRAVPLTAGALYVFDKGYCDYNWWHDIDSTGAYFVTRFKSNAAVNLLEERPIAPHAQGVVLSDQLVTFKSQQAGRRKNLYTKPIRYIRINRPDKDTALVLATNDLTSSALVIAQSYKDRWQIELFFKWIKQHLRIKSFFGRSENAVRIQILTALISYLLVAICKHSHALKGSLWECLSIIRATLFQRTRTEQSWYQRRRQQKRIADFLQFSLF